MDAVPQKSQRYNVTGPDGYTVQIDLFLSAGQYLLRHLAPGEEYHGPLEIRRLVEVMPAQVALYGGVSSLAVHVAFPSQEEEAPPAPVVPPPTRARIPFFGPLITQPSAPEFPPAPVLMPPDKLCLAVIRGLLVSHPPLFAGAGIGPEGLREAQLFAVLAAGAVLEGQTSLELPLRDFMRCWSIPPPLWPRTVQRLIDAMKVGTPPFFRIQLEPGETELDTRFVLNPDTLVSLGFAPPPPRPAQPRPAKTKPQEPAPPTKKTEKEELPPVCTFEAPEVLPPLCSLVVAGEVMEELLFVRALCARGTAARTESRTADGGRPTAPSGPAPRLLFHGPPGTGKTHAVRALAHALDRPLALVLPGALIQKWVGDTEKAIESAFREANEKNALLFLDEADSFLYDRRNALQSHQVSAVNALLNQLDRTRVPVVLCTNFLDSLDSAVHRRIDHMIEFPLPCLPQRRALWKSELHWALLSPPDIDLDRLAALPLSGGLIHNAITQAARRHLVYGDECTINTEALFTLGEKELPKMGTLAVARKPMGFSAPPEEEEAPPDTKACVGP